LGKLPNGSTGLQIRDAAGVLRLEAGHVGNGTSYGISVYDATGVLVFAVTDNGLQLPAESLTPRAANDFVAETQPTFNVSEYWSGALIVSSNAVAASLPWAADNTVTGELRLVVKAAPNTGAAVVAATAAVALPLGPSSGTVRFNWLHGRAKNSGPWFFGVQGRVTGGLGNLNVYRPDYVSLVGGESVGATATGV
jgi:hypothetical protein